MSGALNNFGRARVLKMFADWTDAIAAARCRRRRSGRRASSATSSSRSGTGPIRRPTCTTSSRPTAATRGSTPTGPVYGALELSADYTAGARSQDQHRQPRAADRPRSRTRRRPTRRCPSRRRTGATRRSGPARTTSTTRCSTTRAACGSRRRCGRRPIPPECKAGLERIRRRSCSRWPTPAATSQMYDPATKKLTHIGTCFGTHHLMFAEDANHTLWTSGGGQVIGWLNTKMFEETRRRDEVAGLDGAHPRRQRQRQARRLHRAEPAGRSDQGPAHQRRALRRGAGARRLDLGHAARLPGRGHPAVARREPARDGDHRDLPAARPTRASRRAAATSIATASTGRRWPAATWRASIAASARARSTARTPPASTAPKAGRSTPSRCRSSRA